MNLNKNSLMKVHVVYTVITNAIKQRRSNRLSYNMRNIFWKLILSLLQNLMYSSRKYTYIAIHIWVNAAFFDAPRKVV